MKFVHYIKIKVLVCMSALMTMILFNGCNYFAKPLELSSEHFLFVATTQTSSIAEMQEGIDLAEEFYSTLANIIPREYELDSVIVVQLNGKYRGPGTYAYMDNQGTIQLWRYPEELGGYWSLFAHELVHAIAFDTSVKVGVYEWQSFGFYNEAWAEYLSLLIDPEKTGFPFYGFQENVVVGHWIMHGGIAIAKLRTSHEELNLSCPHQSYTMRASWFRFVDETYGRNVTLEIMYGGKEMTPVVVEKILGESLIIVDNKWQKWVLKHYASHPGADAQAASYRASISYYQPCQ